jgi:peptide/nickel transport system substrate-binding protein
VDTCVNAGTGKGQCGKGVKPGAKLQFSLLYATGVDWMFSAVKELVSNASLVGLQISATPKSTQDVISAVFCAPQPSPSCPAWQMAFWGSWTYAPDYLPTGEELFVGSSAADGGQYNSPYDNKLIGATLSARTDQQFYPAMYKWQDWLAAQVPVVYEPNVATLIESANNLNIGVQSPTLNLNPEDWYYLK